MAVFRGNCTVIECGWGPSELFGRVQSGKDRVRDTLLLTARKFLDHHPEDTQDQSQTYTRTQTILQDARYPAKAKQELCHLRFIVNSTIRSLSSSSVTWAEKIAC